VVAAIDLERGRTRVPAVVDLAIEGTDLLAHVLHLVGDALVGHDATRNTAGGANWCQWRGEDRGRRGEDAEEDADVAHVVDCFRVAYCVCW